MLMRYTYDESDDTTGDIIYYNRDYVHNNTYYLHFAFGETKVAILK